MMLHHISSDSSTIECKGFFAIAKTMTIYMIFSILLNSLVLSTPSFAGTERSEICPTCTNWTYLDDWLTKKVGYEQEQQKSQSDNQEATLRTQDVELTSIPDPVQNNTMQMRTGRFAEVLVPPREVSRNDIVLDISPNATRYLEGAININYENFLDKGGKLKPVSEIARLLGNAGISHNNSLVIAGECLPCGGGPSPAVFTYWLLKYLGHDKVRLIDGSIEDWITAGLNISDKPALRPKTDYNIVLRPQLFSTFDFVVNSGAQIVDARPAKDFGMGSIPGAFNIPYENVIEKESIKPEEDLLKSFIGLKKDRPIVVYTNIGVEASLVWLALTVSGYDARLYTWRDWLENLPKFNFELADVYAKPNPVSSGSTTIIAASFQEKQTNIARNSSSSEIKLTIKGCATCGFSGFSLGTPGIAGNKSGMIQLGSSRKTSQSGTAAQVDDKALRCTAIIKGADGSEAAKISLLRTSGYNYSGIWNANVPPGIYKVSIAASAFGNTETFADVLVIKVT